jgi:phosphoribosylformimino-5-aminoimidazole carboxamide ribotide isomerase
VKLIPVIDLMAGVVVRAVRGERSRYRPIKSALCASCEPVAVARKLIDTCRSDILYVADLDALRGGTAQVGVLAQLAQALPGTHVWLDAGFHTRDEAAALAVRLGGASFVPVFGSESLADEQAFAACFAAPPTTSIAAEPLLSLDRRRDQPLGAAACWTRDDLWPQRVIVMTLDRVGSGAGPDLETLAEVRARAGRRTVIGAGGVRSLDDLDAAAQAGADAWLVASALHDLRISPRG